MNPQQQLDINREWLLSEFGDKAPAILREMQYYNLYGELPPDAIYIESVEWINGSSLVVHRDRDEMRQ